MTVSITTNKVSYIGNGIATSFAIPFPYLDISHLKVYQLLNDIQTERTDWTVQNGNLIFETAPVMDAQIVIIRELPFIQETDYQENEILAAETLEKNFDSLTMQIQQLKEQADRAVTVDLFDETAASDLLPSIRSAVSNAAEYAQSSAEQANNAAQSAQTATEKALIATNKAQEAINTLANKADKSVYASKTVRGVAMWANTYSNVTENRPATVIISYVNGSSWYRLWSDGWIEQGFSISGDSNMLNWPKPFSNTNYTVTSTPVVYNNYGVQAVSITSKTAAGIVWAGTNYSSTCWYACGY